MADVQVDDGYTKIANELLEMFTKVNLSSYEFRVVMAIMRKTYGFSKKEDYISLSQLEDITGIKSCHICRTLKKLKFKNMIISNGHLTGIQKDYDLWAITQIGNTYSGNTQTGNKVTYSGNEITQTGNKKLPKQVDTKEIKKLIQKKDISAHAPFNEIVKLYNDTCISLNKVVEITEKRKSNIAWRWNKFATRKDKSGVPLGMRIFNDLFTRANESDFLSGRIEDKRGFKKQWKASFDWLIEESNLIKVLEGQYDND
jgi:phage replication O-like protein O